MLNVAVKIRAYTIILASFLIVSCEPNWEETEVKRFDDLGSGYFEILRTNPGACCSNRVDIRLNDNGDEVLIATASGVGVAEIRRVGILRFDIYLCGASRIDATLSHPFSDQYDEEGLRRTAHFNFIFDENGETEPLCREQ